AVNLVTDPSMQDAAAWSTSSATGPTFWPASLSINSEGLLEYELNDYAPGDFAGFTSERISVSSGETVHASLDVRSDWFTYLLVYLMFVDSNDSPLDFPSSPASVSSGWGS